MQRYRTMLGASLVLALSVVGMAAAERYVVVNGQRLSNREILRLEQQYCGPIPNGRYWFDARSGLWGYAGNPLPQGHITDNCVAHQHRRPSLSERGMLFSPHDWVR